MKFFLLTLIVLLETYMLVANAENRDPQGNNIHGFQQVVAR